MEKPLTNLVLSRVLALDLGGCSGAPAPIYRFSDEGLGVATNCDDNHYFDRIEVYGSIKGLLRDLACLKEMDRIYNKVMSRQNKSQANTN